MNRLYLVERWRKLNSIQAILWESGLDSGQRLLTGVFSHCPANLGAFVFN